MPFSDDYYRFAAEYLSTRKDAEGESIFPTMSSIYGKAAEILGFTEDELKKLKKRIPFLDALVLVANHHFFRTSRLFPIDTEAQKIGCGLIFDYEDEDEYCRSFPSIGSYRCSCRNQKDWSCIGLVKDLLTKEYLPLDHPEIIQTNDIPKGIVPKLKHKPCSFEPCYEPGDTFCAIMCRHWFCGDDRDYVFYGNHV